MRKKWFHMVCWFLCNLSRAGESVALATKKFLICQKRRVLAAEDSLQPLWKHIVQMLKAVIEKMSCCGRVKNVAKCKKKVVKNVAFLYQTTPARLNAADCPFNPTSTMPLNSMWPRCALPRKLLLTFDFDCFVPFLLFCSTPPALCHSLSCGSIVYYQEDYY